MNYLFDIPVLKRNDNYDKLDDLTEKQQQQTAGGGLVEKTIKCNKLQQPKPLKKHTRLI